MKISKISITHHRIPLDPPFNPSWDTRPRTAFTATIVRVETDTGLVGIGSGDEMVGFLGHENLFIGQDPLAIERHYRLLSNLGFHYGRCWPLDIALWDLAGKITNQPCWKLLGGLSNKVPAYASSGSLRDPRTMGSQARHFVGRGFKAMKVRFHRADWRDDVRALEAVRAEVGDRLHVMVDCNQGWRMAWDFAEPWSLKDAVQVARQLERLGVYWMEKPLFRGDYQGMATLRQEIDVRIAGGEMTREIYEFRDLITRGCLDVLQPDVALVGDITGLRRVAHMANEFNLVFTPHTWGNGVMLAAALHLTAGTGGAPYIEFPCDPPYFGIEARDFMLAQPLRTDAAGLLNLDEGPGLGFEIDEARLSASRIG